MPSDLTTVSVQDATSCALILRATALTNARYKISHSFVFKYASSASTPSRYMTDMVRSCEVLNNQRRALMVSEACTLQ